MATIDDIDNFGLNKIKSTDETQISTIKKQLKDIFVQVDQEK